MFATTTTTRPPKILPTMIPIFELADRPALLATAGVEDEAVDVAAAVADEEVDARAERSRIRVKGKFPH